MEIKIKKYVFCPFVDINSKGFLGFLNATLGTDTEDILQLNSLGVYGSRFDEKEKVRLTMPAKPTGGGYNYFFKILSEPLLRELTKIAEEEVVKNGYLIFSNEEK
jgi:hypothetical protein